MLLGILLLLPWLPAGLVAATGTPTGNSSSRHEYDVKAAFLHKFPLFVEWPAPAFASPQAPVVVAILGRDPFGQRLENVISNRTVNGRTFVFHRVRLVEEALAARCHMVFISPSEEERLPAILTRLQNLPVLTIGDTPGYGSQGVMLNFFLQDQTVKFEVNRAAAKAAGLSLSSQLPGPAPKPSAPRRITTPIAPETGRPPLLPVNWLRPPAWERLSAVPTLTAHVTRHRRPPAARPDHRITPTRGEPA